MSRQNLRKVRWVKRKLRTRSKIFGSTERPRLSVFKSNKHLYAQIIDDAKGVTLASSSTVDKELKGKVIGNVQGAKKVGAILAKRAKQKGIQTVVFDRHGFRYHGQLKALAEAVREGGLQF